MIKAQNLHTRDANIDQLLTESHTGYSASYSYDANGNRATKTLNGVTDTYTNNSVDELTRITEGGSTIKSYTYDNAGRTKTVTTSAGETDLSYDYEGRLTQITYPDTSTNTFAYNGLDTRVSKTDSSGTASHMRDGADVTDPVINDGTANYTPGISERRSSTTKFVHSDQLGSMTALSDSSQTVTDTRQYDAFGMLVSSTGSTTTPFGFAGGHGYQSDSDSGLMLLGHRYYDPSTGRFLARDPVRDGRNWFAYVQNRPLNSSDPSGYQGPGAQAALDGYFLIGGGHKDCKMWVEDCYEGIKPLPPEHPAHGKVKAEWTVANDFDEWFAAHPKDWKQISNLIGDREPGDVIVINRPGTGHVQLVGFMDEILDASIASGKKPARPGTDQGVLYTPGVPIPEKPGETITIWRPVS